MSIYCLTISDCCQWLLASTVFRNWKPVYGQALITRGRCWEPRCWFLPGSSTVVAKLPTFCRAVESIIIRSISKVSLHQVFWNSSSLKNYICLHQQGMLPKLIKISPIRIRETEGPAGQSPEVLGEIAKPHCLLLLHTS